MVSSKPFALLSVTDKTGLADFGRALAKAGYELLSTGGTCQHLRDAGLEVTTVEEYTGQAEILGGRVKTLHPLVHGGILFDRDRSEHAEQVAQAGIRPIDVVVVNLYDYAGQALAKKLEATAAIEYIDIGGPCMIRAAAKNFAAVTVVTDPSQYAKLSSVYEAGDRPDQAQRQELAAAAFARTAAYDAMIQESLYTTPIYDRPHVVLPLQHQQSLRYGENPHQEACLLVRPGQSPSLADIAVLQGKELSYNNYLDLDAAMSLVREWQELPAAVVIKHTNPCGAAVGTAGDTNLATVYERALASDPKSAFGGIVAFNRPVDGATANLLKGTFLECIAAPAFLPEARETLASRANLRLVEAGFLSQPLAADQLQWRGLSGGVLLQGADATGTPAGEGERSAWRVVTKAQPNAAQRRDLDFALAVCKHAKSNAITLARAEQIVGVGAGQMSRVDAAQIAVAKAKEHGHGSEGSVLASDAFFPFGDTVTMAAEQGIKAIIQPGGSKRDEESIAAANAAGIAMVFTGQRHFRH